MRNKTKKFSKDLEYGTHFEWESIKYIEDFFNKFLIKQNKSLKFLNENFSTSVKELKKWDMKYILVDNFTNQRLKEITFEIKTDKFDETGNLFFEKSCNKKVSGVFTTEANYFIYILPRYKENNFYIVKPEKLIKLLNSKFPSCISYGCGDGGRVASFLINKNTFDEEFDGVGKLLTWDVEIPAKFGISSFAKKNTTTYYADASQKSIATLMKKYENPLD
jgi:hypothetical protein